MKLEIGYQSDFEVRKECINIQNAVNFTVLYLSDLHLTGFNHTLVERIVQSVEKLDPSIILLGGDYADSNKGVFYFDKLLKAISSRQNIFVITGNHDYFFGISKIRNLCDRYSNIIWIENTVKCIDIDGFKVQITGNKPQTHLQKADFNILCLHEPIDITPYQTQFDLVFAGHLHGCQVVFWETEKGLFPGKFFYQWNILKTQIGSCLYLVSKGLGDTLPLRFNCRKDIVFVEIMSKD